jgi:hypothetical protein
VVVAVWWVVARWETRKDAATRPAMTTATERFEPVVLVDDGLLTGRVSVVVVICGLLLAGPPLR